MLWKSWRINDQITKLPMQRPSISTSRINFILCFHVQQTIGHIIFHNVFCMYREKRCSTTPALVRSSATRVWCCRAWRGHEPVCIHAWAATRRETERATPSTWTSNVSTRWRSTWCLFARLCVLLYGAINLNLLRFEINLIWYLFLCWCSFHVDFSFRRWVWGWRDNIVHKFNICKQNLFMSMLIKRTNKIISYIKTHQLSWIWMVRYQMLF